jgi:hypothetical protein
MDYDRRHKETAMNGRQMTRRIMLGTLAVTLALPGLRAAAAVEGPMDFGSREDFEDYCESVGGDFTDTGDGNLWCQDFTGGQTVCDGEGNDCYTIPFMPPTSTWPELGNDPLTQGGDAAPPEAGNPNPPGATAPDDNLDHGDTTGAKGKGKHHKHHKHKGKHRKR